ncbi:hypothetical protein ACIA2T_29810 [Amycolatopsis japonica]|uniref:hypothetical protein n=1 Tax=Amycolatopsis japonica TaxID=208439 RepID=UPI0037AF1C30
MVEPLIVWIGKVVEKTFDRAMTASDRKTRRHDLSIEGAEATSDLDIIVKYTLPYWRGAKAPVRLTLQRVDGYPETQILRMVLGETLRVRLKRGTYEITAWVVQLSPQLGQTETLHAVGWQRVWLGHNRTKKARLRPAPVLVQAPGRVGPKRSGAKSGAPKPSRKPSTAQASRPDLPAGGRRIGQPSED